VLSLAPLAPLLVGAGCTVDTELAVDADFRSADISVTGSGATTVVAVDLVVDFRVGEHSPDGDRQFTVTTANLFVDGTTPVAEVRVDDRRTLSPGQSETLTLTGMTPPGAFPSARDLLCGAGEALVLIQWSEYPTSMPPAMDDFDMESFSTSSITCD
jgi:hypothetical protein